MKRKSSLAGPFCAGEVICSLSTTDNGNKTKTHHTCCCFVLHTQCSLLIPRRTSLHYFLSFKVNQPDINPRKPLIHR